MEDFVFSLQATVPVFFIIFLGYFLKRIHIIREGFVDEVNDLVFKVLFPVVLFRDVASTELAHMFSPKFFWFCFLSTSAAFLTMWLLSEKFIKDKSQIGSITVCSVRGSAAVLGIAFAMNIYGNVGMVPLMIIASVPLYNIFTVIIFTIRGRERSQQIEPKKMLLSILKNPLIIGILLGIPFALFEIRFPVIIDRCLENVSVMSTPLALILVGAGFNGQKSAEKMGATVLATVIKLILLPVIFLPIAILMGFRGPELVAILIMLGAPTTVSCYIMAKSMGNDEIIASGTVIFSTVFSAVTFTALIYILRAAAFI